MKKIFSILLVGVSFFVHGDPGWPLIPFVQNGEQILFSGRLVDDRGPYKYISAYLTGYHVSGKNYPCGLFRRENEVLLISPTGQEDFNPGQITWEDIEKAIATIGDGEVRDVLTRTGPGLPWARVTVIGGLVRELQIEFSFPDDGQFSTAGTKMTFVIRFIGTRPIEYEQRTYFNPKKPEPMIAPWPMLNMPMLKHDAEGLPYHMLYRCEVSVVS